MRYVGSLVELRLVAHNPAGSHGRRRAAPRASQPAPYSDRSTPITREDNHEAARFYEHLYAHGYMSYHPAENTRRLREVLRTLGLPESGDALDYGCGSGVMTAVLGAALPGWRIYGADISAGAVQNAARLCPSDTFFRLGDAEWSDRRFDLVVTHHVLEHVDDLDRALDDIFRCVKPASSLLHVLPCGNPGSFEYRLCLLRDGIDRAHENRFFYEVGEHVRRLTTDDLSARHAARGFHLAKEFYGNQHDGGINWITQSRPEVIRSLLDVSPARDEAARRELRALRFKLVATWLLRAPATILDRLGHKRRRSVVENLALLAALPLWPLSWPVGAYWRARARREWDRRKSDRGGSEMYLYFTGDEVSSGT